MIRFLKGKQILVIVAISILIISFWIVQFLWRDVNYIEQSQTDSILLFKAFNLNSFSVSNQILSVFVAFTLLCLLSVSLIKAYNEFTFINHRNYLPALILALIVIPYQPFLQFQAAYIGSIFMLLALFRIFSSYSKTIVYSNFFDAGFLFSIGSLFYYDLVFISSIVFISILVYKIFNWRNWSVAILGLVSPYIFLYGIYYFVYGQINGLSELIKSQFAFEPTLIKTLPFSYFCFIVLISVLFIVSVIFHFRQTHVKINTRNSNTLLLWNCLIIIALWVFHIASQNLIILYSVPVSVFISNFLTETKRIVIATIVFSVMLICALLVTFV